MGDFFLVTVALTKVCWQQTTRHTSSDFNVFARTSRANLDDDVVPFMTRPDTSIVNATGCRSPRNFGRVCIANFIAEFADVPASSTFRVPF